jgi:predicted nucleic acid-binding Zn ribbon protein
MEKKCPECGDPIHGRADKKFCSDQCRNAFNNRAKSTAGMAYVRKINGILARNRNILEAMNPDGKISLHKSKLYKKGFNTDYFTHIYKTRAGKMYYFCYDQGYMEISDEYYVLVRDKYTEK